MLDERDDLDGQILLLLQANARMTMRELGKTIGLSGAATAERVRRLEERGVIRRYLAEVEPARIGLGVVAFVTLAVSYDVRPARTLEREVQGIDEVVECYRITGEDGYLLKVAVPDMEALREVLDRLGDLGRVKTSVVLSVPKHPTPMRPRPRQPSQPVLKLGAD